MKSSFRVIVAVAASLLGSPYAASAQDVPVPPAQTNAPPTQPAVPADLLKPAELEALVSPIALYPDDLLSLVLMASTYPLEVVEAQRWFDANKKLSDEQRKAALEKLSWDQSVKSLVATPTVLEMMSTQLAWTRKLGDAVLAQEADVMDAVQRLRTKAHSRDKLVTTKQQKVTVQRTGPRQTIAIEPVDPNLIYVPYYEPAIVYGDWPYVDYPPYFFPYPGFYGDPVFATGIWFGIGYGLGYWGGGYVWGGRCNWANSNLYYRNGNRWTHRPEHRRGVGYASDRIQRQFGNQRGSRDQLNLRGRDGKQGADRANRAAASNRRDAARTRDARGNRQATRAGRSGQRAAQRSGARSRAVQRQAAQRGRVAARQSSRGRMSLRGGGRDFVRRGGGSFRASGFREYRGGDGFHGGGGRAAFSGGQGFRGGGGAAFRGGGGGFRGGGGGGFRGGGGGGGHGHGGGGGRRSDIQLKEDFVLVGRLDSGLGIYRFRYRDNPQTYVGVMAQDAQMVQPDAVTRGHDGYLRVRYDKIGFEMQTYDRWAKRARKVQGL